MSDTIHNDAGSGLMITGPAPSSILRVILGLSLCFAAGGLWLVPGASFDPALVLVKLGATVFFALGGAMFLLATRSVQHPEVYLDGQRGKMKLLNHNERGEVASEVLVDFDELSEVDFRDGMLIARDHHGRAVVQMPIEETGDLDEIRAALGPAFSRTA